MSMSRYSMVLLLSELIWEIDYTRAIHDDTEEENAHGKGIIYCCTKYSDVASSTASANSKSHTERR